MQMIDPVLRHSCDLSLFSCDLCKDLLVEPITFLCGNTVCKKHLEELLKKDLDFFRCVLCDKMHGIPEDGFIINKRIQNAVETELNCLKQNRMFFESKRKIEEATEQVAKFESLVKDPGSYINERFDEIKKHVNWRRVDLKRAIDKHADELVESIERNRCFSLELSKQNVQMMNRIQELKQNLGMLRNQFSVLDTNDNKLEQIRDSNYPSLEQIKTSAGYLENTTSRMIAELKESLTLNKNYVFVFLDNPMEDVLGKVIDKMSQENKDVTMGGAKVEERRVRDMPGSAKELTATSPTPLPQEPLRSAGIRAGVYRNERHQLFRTPVFQVNAQLKLQQQQIPPLQQPLHQQGSHLQQPQLMPLQQQQLSPLQQRQLSPQQQPLQQQVSPLQLPQLSSLQQQPLQQQRLSPLQQPLQQQRLSPMQQPLQQQVSSLQQPQLSPMQQPLQQQVSPLQQPQLSPLQQPLQQQISPLQQPQLSPLQQPLQQQVSPLQQPQLSPLQQPLQQQWLSPMQQPLQKQVSSLQQPQLPAQQQPQLPPQQLPPQQQRLSPMQQQLSPSQQLMAQLSPRLQENESEPKLEFVLFPYPHLQLTKRSNPKPKLTKQDNSIEGLEKLQESNTQQKVLPKLLPKLKLKTDLQLESNSMPMSAPESPKSSEHSIIQMQEVLREESIILLPPKPESQLKSKLYITKDLTSISPLAYEGHIYHFSKKNQKQNFMYLCKNYFNNNCLKCPGSIILDESQTIVDQYIHFCDGIKENESVISTDFEELKENRLKDYSS